MLYWTRDPSADPPTWQAAIEADSPIDAVSCRTVRFCVAGTTHGRLLWSADPGSVDPLWRSTEPHGLGGISGVSCPSLAACLLGTTNGPIIWAPNSRSDGTFSRMAGTDRVAAVSLACPSSHLCFEVDFEGRLTDGRS